MFLPACTRRRAVAAGGCGTSGCRFASHKGRRLAGPFASLRSSREFDHYFDRRFDRSPVKSVVKSRQSAIRLRSSRTLRRLLILPSSLKSRNALKIRSCLPRTCVRACVRACLCEGVHAGLPASLVRVRARVRACVRACVRAYVRACAPTGLLVRACARAHVRAFLRACVLARLAAACTRARPFVAHSLAVSANWAYACVRACVRACMRACVRASVIVFLHRPLAHRIHELESASGMTRKATEEATTEASKRLLPLLRRPYCDAIRPCCGAIQIACFKLGSVLLLLGTRTQARTLTRSHTLQGRTHHPQRRNLSSPCASRLIASSATRTTTV